MWYDAEVNIFLYHVEYEVELGVCVGVCVRASGFDRRWAYPREVKKMGKEKFFFLLRCQIAGCKSLAPSKSGFDFMPLRDKTDRFFSTNKFLIRGLTKNLCFFNRREI